MSSTFTFATKLLSALAHRPTIVIPDLEGEILLNPNAVEQNSMRIVIHAAFLTVTGDLSDKDHKEMN